MPGSRKKNAFSVAAAVAVAVVVMSEAVCLRLHIAETVEIAEGVAEDVGAGKGRALCLASVTENLPLLYSALLPL